MGIFHVSPARAFTIPITANMITTIFKSHPIIGMKEIIKFGDMLKSMSDFGD